MAEKAKEEPYDWAENIPGLIIAGSILLILSSFLVPGYQGYTWLKTGEWQPLRTNVIFSKIMNDEYYDWLETKSWAGAKTVLRYITVNMSLFLFWLVVSIIIFSILIRVVF